MQKIILWGTGQISEIVEYYINKESAFEICAYTMDKDYITEKTFNNKPVVAFEEIEKYYSPSEYQMAIPISFKKVNKIRENRAFKAKEKGYTLIKYISKYANCNANEIGDNVFIFPFVSVLPFTKIGNNVFMWPSTSVGHHCIIEDNCFLASPKVAGCVHIGKNCFLGTNSTICDTLDIGSYSVIGAGALVTKNIKEGSIIAEKQTKASPVSTFTMEDILG